MKKEGKMAKKHSFKLMGFAIALVVFMTLAGTGLCEDKKVYKLKYAWNDIWGPKFRASQIYRPGGEMQRMLFERERWQDST